MRCTRCASCQASASSTWVTTARESRNVASAACIARSCSMLVAIQGKAASSASRGGRPIACVWLGMPPGSARHEARSAQSATVRASTPSVSSVGLNTLTPWNGSTSTVGLKPTTPQYAAGRINEPLVCVPIAAGTCPSATAAAEPDDEPPGVYPARHGFLVLPGWTNANSVVTVLPSTNPPARRSRSMQSASYAGRPPA